MPEDHAQNVAANYLTEVMLHAGPAMPAESVPVCRQMALLLVRAASIMGRRQRAYGLGNVQLLGGEGVMRRAEEKMLRIKHLTASGGDGGDEGLADSLLDIANLSLIALMTVEGTWPGAAWKGNERSELDVLREENAALKARIGTLAPVYEVDPEPPKRFAPPAMRPLRADGRCQECGEGVRG